ncbi:hypothetical protein FHS85_004918 [Rhodoligotrophos appendicifer]|uniref:hypothetical protein n=1 Tax=Rhodoligotrophos appendicifer TaxID=987056 RepID=UPI0011859E8F|nr:hypothetical protein [Rhodoligotrophos appendicifer]
MDRMLSKSEARTAFGSIISAIQHFAPPKRRATRLSQNAALSKITPKLLGIYANPKLKRNHVSPADSVFCKKREFKDDFERCFYGDFEIEFWTSTTGIDFNIIAFDRLLMAGCLNPSEPVPDEPGFPNLDYSGLVSFWEFNRGPWEETFTGPDDGFFGRSDWIH